jgi:hypothetical protein
VIKALEMPATDVWLTAIERLPWAEFEELRSDSVADGRRTLLRLAKEWRAGVNRFARPGERLIAVGRTVG